MLMNALVNEQFSQSGRLVAEIEKGASRPIFQRQAVGLSAADPRLGNVISNRERIMRRARSYFITSPLYARAGRSATLVESGEVSRRKKSSSSNIIL